MSKKQLLVLVILSLINLSIQDVTDNKVDSQEESPLADVAKEILKEKNLDNIRGMINGFMQSDGAKQLIDDVLQSFGNNENSGHLMEGLGNILNTVGSDDKKGSHKNSKDDINPLDLISGLGSIIGGMQGHKDGQKNPGALLEGLGSILKLVNEGDGNNAGNLIQGIGAILGGALQKNDKGNGDDNSAGALLQGLGSILGAAANNKKGKGDSLLQGLGSLLGGTEEGLNPELIGNVINMITNSDNSEDKKRKKAKPAEKKGKKAKKEIDDDLGSENKNLEEEIVDIKHQEVENQGSKVKQENGKSIDDLISAEIESKDIKDKDKDQPIKPKHKDNIDLTKSHKVKAKRKKAGSSTKSLDKLIKSENGIDLASILKSLSLYIKMAKSFGGPELKKYFEPIDDVMEIYNGFVKKKADFNLSKIIEKVGRILKAVQEIIVPLLPKRLPSASKASSEDNFGYIINMATDLLNQGKDDGSGFNFISYLPMIMDTFNAFTGQEAQARAGSHLEHSGTLPPALEKLHILYDNFINSDMGKQAFEYISKHKAFKLFLDETGNFSIDKFVEMIENHSFRRHWIQQVTNRLVEFLKLVSDEKLQAKYSSMGVAFANNFLTSYGFPKEALLNINKPAKSISYFANYVAKQYLEADLDAAEYVEPFVQYTQDVLKLAKSSLKLGAHNRELHDKLTDTINMEIIEPITRVNRAYRFVKTQPQCDKYIFCIINEQDAPNEPKTLPIMKKALYKGTSLVATWFLSSHTKTPYWDLYEVITNTRNCHVYHKDVCNGFYHEEIKATTEYVHNEL